MTEALKAEVDADLELSFESEFRAIPFDTDGNLQQEVLFPESQRARRNRS